MTKLSPPTIHTMTLSPLQVLVDCHVKGERCALVTLVNCHGASPRRRGAQMAVSAGGMVSGSFSGGCFDHAVIEDARRTLAAGESRRVRYGADSPYLDVTMPCGSGLDLQFDGAIPAATLATIAMALRQRQPATLHWADSAAPPQCTTDSAIGRLPAGGTSVRLVPALRLLLAGAGENLWAMGRLAQASDIEVQALSPDRDLLDALRALGVATRALVAADSIAPIECDPFTAAITLFHEHQWELPFLAQALNSDAFLVGAMGSRRAQALRIERLREAGVAAPALDRLRGPIGLLPQARDPRELALSILAEVMQTYRQVAFPEADAER